MSTLVENETEIAENVFYLNAALENTKERGKAKDLLKRGRKIISVLDNETWYFAPSRFAGYKNNSIKRHSKIDKNGTETEKIFKKFTHLVASDHPLYDTLDKAYQDHCELLGEIPNNYKDRAYRVLNSQEGELDFELKSKTKELDYDDHAKRIAKTVLATVKYSGQKRTTISKLKTTDLNKAELENLVKQLMNSQKKICKLTALKMKLNGNKNFFPSLDRVDSNLGYTEINLQLVCRFANRWKSDQDNAEFLRLMKKIKKD